MTSRTERAAALNSFETLMASVLPGTSLELAAPELQDACSNLVRQLRALGYPHADHTTCSRFLRAYFDYDPVLSEGSHDTVAAAGFLERLLQELVQREREVSTPARARRCYGQAVEQAVMRTQSHGEFTTRAPRLTELMTQLDADGHNTTQLRIELEGLIDEIGMKQFYG